MRHIGIIDDDDDHYHYMYDDELYPEGKLTLRTSTTSPLILDLSPGSTQGRGNKITPLKEMRQRLPMPLAKLRAGNTSENR